MNGRLGIAGGLSLSAAGFWLAALTSSWLSEPLALIAVSVLIYMAAAAAMGGSDR